MKYLLFQEETERLLFRGIDISDFDDWLNFFKDPKSFEHWKRKFQEPEMECQQWYQRQLERYEDDEGGMNALVDKNSVKLIGYAGLLVQTIEDKTELEVAYSLLSNFRNKGFATEAAKKCRDFAFKNNFADSLISIISLTNTQSANVAVKIGMKKDKQTVYKDNPVNIFRIDKRDWQRLNK